MPHNINSNNEGNAVNGSRNTYDKQNTIPVVTANKVYNIIKKLKNRKAPGIDFINGKILKNLPPKIIQYITIVFNAVLRIQYFPSI